MFTDEQIQHWLLKFTSLGYDEHSVLHVLNDPQWQLTEQDLERGYLSQKKRKAAEDVGIFPTGFDRTLNTAHKLILTTGAVQAITQLMPLVTTQLAERNYPPESVNAVFSSMLVHAASSGQVAAFLEVSNWCQSDTGNNAIIAIAVIVSGSLALLQYVYQHSPLILSALYKMPYYRQNMSPLSCIANFGTREMMQFAVKYYSVDDEVISNALDNPNPECLAVLVKTHLDRLQSSGGFNNLLAKWNTSKDDRTWVLELVCALGAGPEFAWVATKLDLLTLTKVAIEDKNNGVLTILLAQFPQVLKNNYVELTQLMISKKNFAGLLSLVAAEPLTLSELEKKWDATLQQAFNAAFTSWIQTATNNEGVMVIVERCHADLAFELLLPAYLHAVAGKLLSSIQQAIILLYASAFESNSPALKDLTTSTFRTIDPAILAQAELALQTRQAPNIPQDEVKTIARQHIHSQTSLLTKHGQTPADIQKILRWLINSLTPKANQTYEEYLENQNMTAILRATDCKLQFWGMSPSNVHPLLQIAQYQQLLEEAYQRLGNWQKPSPPIGVASTSNEFFYAPHPPRDVDGMGNVALVSKRS